MKTMKFQLITSCKDLCAMNYIKETFWSLLHINIDELYMRYCSFSPVEEGRWSSSYCKLWDSSYFGILKGSILKINLVIRLEGGRNHIFGPKLGPKVPKLHKIPILRTGGRRKLIHPSKWPQDLIYCGWSETCIPLRQPEVP